MTNKIKPSDCIPTGAITGRMVGMTLTLANPKPNQLDRLGTEIKALLQNAEGTDFRLCSFDVAQEELVIIAVYNAFEYCRFHGIKPDALATEGSQYVLLGNSQAGTDAHSKLAKRFGITRSESKTLGLSLCYGAGQVSACNLLRPTLGLKMSEKELKNLVDEYFLYFKGYKNRGDYSWQNGLFSHFFNYAQRLISEKKPRLPFGGQLITNTLQPEMCGTDFYTSRMNWAVQATGSYILDCLGYEIDKQIFQLGLEEQMWYQLSCHDELVYMCHQEQVSDWEQIARRAYRSVWDNFFGSFGMSCPEEVILNLELCSDTVYRKAPDTNLLTASGVGFLDGVGNGIKLGQ
jgi:hypothetical protein